MRAGLPVGTRTQAAETVIGLRDMTGLAGRATFNPRAAGARTMLKDAIDAIFANRKPVLHDNARQLSSHKYHLARPEA
jgi:hypothetical protein